MTAVRSGRPRVASLRIAFAAAVAALLSACGTSNNFNPGTPVLTLSSTNTRFACYIVTIDQIVLYGPNDQTAVPLPVPVTVDLTRQTDLSAVLSAYAAPQGTFNAAVITIDYTYANIWVNENGVSVHVAPSVLVGGTSALVAAMTVTFDPSRPLVVTNQEAIRAHMNFDLDAFNSIDLANLTVTVHAVRRHEPTAAAARSVEHAGARLFRLYALVGRLRHQHPALRWLRDGPWAASRSMSLRRRTTTSTA